MTGNRSVLVLGSTGSVGTQALELIAENPAYEPIVTTNVSLVGVVRGVIRMFR
jgi:1-deoxy-D-xylulose 5-phosphate reductoisomerase